MTATKAAGASPRAVNALRVGAGSITVAVVCSVCALGFSLWPFFGGQTANPFAASALLMVLLPAMFMLVLAGFMEGSMDAKTLALLGVLSAAIAAVRPLGAGVGGVETVFFLLVLGGRAFGPAFGFALGGVSLLASALLTGGVGPWLGMQMVCSSWIAAGAGLLPGRAGRIRGRAEIAMLAAYGAICSYLFGALMNLWFWPALGGAGAGASGIGYLPGAPVGTNLRHFVAFTLVTSTTSWDTIRAITCVIALVVLGGPVLALLRRAGARAAFGAVPEFGAPNAGSASKAEASAARMSKPASATVDQPGSGEP
ncbi:MAG: ECF transporter S component [Bifidobacteriaceae bacterium]|jgi:energy-coupling factor transport system substrate-specific component|nr:ECF transporter S component [Bifidobacteriaceae bacterium]